MYPLLRDSINSMVTIGKQFIKRRKHGINHSLHPVQFTPISIILGWTIVVCILLLIFLDHILDNTGIMSFIRLPEKWLRNQRVGGVIRNIPCLKG